MHAELRYDAVPAGTLECVKYLMRVPMLSEAYLVGGTALALYLGHRISIDVDMFLPHGFDVAELSKEVARYEPFSTSFMETNRARNTLQCTINNVKTDIITFAYPMIEPVSILDGLRIASIRDIAAMKLSAVVNRGAKKDFWDIHTLLTLFTMDELLDCFRHKFRQIEVFQVIRALTYFEEADADPDPITLAAVSWKTIQSDIIGAVQRYTRLSTIVPR
jgi:Nucleotidyl transferase AbiEii toxin, Type IV TA system